MNTALTPNRTLGSPQRKLNVRPQSAKSPRRHQNAYAVSSESQTWITKTLHQLQSSTCTRAPSHASPRPSRLCSICRTPLAKQYYGSCGAPRSPWHRRSRPSNWPGSRLYSVAPAAQPSTGGFGNGPPSGNGSTGGGGNGDGSSNNSSGHDSRQYEAPLAETKQVKGLEDILLLDVQGMKCGGCVSRVKRILEGHSYVTQATVNLATETALVRAAMSDEQDGHAQRLEVVGKELAQALSEAGFSSSLRSVDDPTGASNNVVRQKREERKSSS